MMGRARKSCFSDARGAITIPLEAERLAMTYGAVAHASFV
jgi:hypothetical protein